MRSIYCTRRTLQANEHEILLQELKAKKKKKNGEEGNMKKEQTDDYHTLKYKVKKITTLNCIY